MPTRKQRRRAAKEHRHQYETVWVDAEGNELEEPPEDVVAARSEPHNGKAAAAKPERPQRPQRGARTGRVPPQPSWNRAIKRAGLLGIVVFFLFYVVGGKGGNKELSALALAALYTALFIPFTYVIDRFAYQRFQRREAGAPKRPPKKR